MLLVKNLLPFCGSEKEFYFTAKAETGRLIKVPWCRKGLPHGVILPKAGA
jgi:hypothetical protein